MSIDIPKRLLSDTSTIFTNIHVQDLLNSYLLDYMNQLVFIL